MIRWTYRLCRTCHEVYDEAYHRKTCSFCGTWVGTGDEAEDAKDTARLKQGRRRKTKGGRYQSA